MSQTSATAERFDRARVEEQLEAGRARVADAYEHAREATEPARERLSDAAARAAEAAAPKVEEARRVARPAARRVKQAAVEGATVVSDLIPSILERVVAVLKALFGDLEERGRELAHNVEPPRKVVRRKRWKTVAWFAGGFAVGAGAGWYAHQRYSDQGIEGAQDADAHARDVASDRAPYGEDAAAIDASRTDISVN